MNLLNQWIHYHVYHHFQRIMFRIYCSMNWNKYTGPIKRSVAKLACPGGYDEHFWHDGCPYCDN